MDYDLVIIGGGPGGYEAALHAAEHGMKTALVEANNLGGTCLNLGCVPTKALLHSAHLVDSFNESTVFGVTAGEVSYELSDIYTRKDSVVSTLRNSLERLLKSKKIDVFMGYGKITDKHIVEVSSSEETFTLSSQNILIASGSRSSMPPIKGIDSEGVTGSDSLINSPPDFKSLLIIGGGVIGVEFASVFSSFGIEVTIIESISRILPLMDREISMSLAMVLKKRNITVITDALVQEIVKSGNLLTCNFLKGEQDNSLEVEHILVATGRVPNYTNLFDESLGIETKRGIVVDEMFRTSCEGVYAIGDVVDSNIQLAHVASAQGIAAVSYMLNLESKAIDFANIPACIYTKPEIASVGMTVESAKQMGLPAKTQKYIMGGNARTLIENSERGFIKLVISEDNGRILGAHLMCERASDIIGEL
ncbi:MAG: dihydrolipoyl dehydrogenase, partial [Oscillospiraceae bacterium]|nr:dihydrolipoyl dehydrogenase [Oscillospiraceae bacterium]